MRLNRRFPRFATLLLAVVASAAVEAAGLSSAVARLAEQVDALGAHPEIAGLSVAVVSRDRVLYQQVYGVREKGVPGRVDIKTRFRIASLSKAFASTLAGLLVSEGALAWSDRVADDVSYFRLKNAEQAANVRIEHLLSHRVGLPHNAYDRLLEANWTPRNIVQRYEQVRPICPVGSCYGYQNITYDLISRIVATRLHDSYGSLLQARVFEPLGMHGAGLGADHLTFDENYARPHVRTRGRARPVDIKTHYYLVPAAAGVNLTTEDLVQWMQAQLGANPGILSTERLEELWVPRVRTRREMIYGGWRGRRLNDAWYGLGWRIYDYAGERVIYHAGAVEGYRAQIAVLPQRDLAVAAMWNSESGKPWGVVPVFVDALLGLPAEDWMKLNRSSAGGHAE